MPCLLAQAVMAARRRQVEEERAAAEAAQVRLMEQMTARHEAQVCSTARLYHDALIPALAIMSWLSR